MLKSEPLTFSAAFGISSAKVRKAGAVDVALNCDTKLFIDPLLMRESDHKAFAKCASNAYQKRFELVIKLLVASKRHGDVAWRGARRQLSFPEMPYTQLGYSSSTSGSGFGTLLTDSLIESAKQVIDLGVTDPDIFVALALFEDNIGADRISDMTSQIVFECLLGFTERIASTLALPTKPFDFRQFGQREFNLPVNPESKKGNPVVLVPHDVVRDLPVASDWGSVAAAAQETQDLRDRVNADIGAIWGAKTKKDKREFRKRLLSSKKAMETFLEVFRNAADAPYDVAVDHNGELYPSDLRNSVASQFPLSLATYAGRSLNAKEANEVVTSIIEQFRQLIESNGLWSLLWDEDGSAPRHEKAAQQVFFAVANAYCKANNLDVTPEANAGNGPVDFKFSAGYSLRILVELKKSTNSAVVSGYTDQLEIYKDADETTHAHYIVVDYGRLSAMTKRRLSDAHDAAAKSKKGASKIWYVDASPRASASKRKAKSAP